MSRDNFSCVRCNDATRTLHIHHKEYFSGHSPWEYADEILETLCIICHKKEHNLIPKNQPERIQQHVAIQIQAPLVIASIDKQIKSLTKTLQDATISNELMEDILKNVMFLNKARMNFLKNNYV